MSRRRRQERKELAHDIDTIALEAAERIMQISYQPMLGGAPQLKAKIQCEVRAALDVLATAKLIQEAPSQSALTGDDLLDLLQRVIDEAEHKPGDWCRSLNQMGGICTTPMVGFDAFTLPSWGSFSYKRDAWLAIAAVNALPKLMERVRSAEAELERLRATMPATTPCCGDPRDCAQPCEAERKPASDELPAGLSWGQAPEWATVLVRHLDGQHAWAAAYANGAKATKADRGATVTGIGDIHRAWTLIATRPTKKAPCTDCGACVGGPHGCGKPGLHGEATPRRDATQN